MAPAGGCHPRGQKRAAPSARALPSPPIRAGTEVVATAQARWALRWTVAEAMLGYEVIPVANDNDTMTTDAWVKAAKHLLCLAAMSPSSVDTEQLAMIRNILTMVEAFQEDNRDQPVAGAIEKSSRDQTRVEAIEDEPNP